MKILRISSRFHPPHSWLRDPEWSSYMKKYRAVGGMQLQVYLLTEALSKLGVEQEIITVRPPWASATEQRENVKIHRYGLPLPIDRQLYELPALIAALRYASKGVDLIHIHHGEDIAAIPIGLLAAKRANSPVIITLHSSWNLTYRRVGSLPSPREILGKSIEKIGISRADGLCVLTSRTARLLSNEFGIDSSKVYITPDGFDTFLFQPHQDYPSAEFIKKYGIPASSCYILYIGRLDPQKGVSFLLDAAAILRKRGEEFILIICGDGIERRSLQRQTIKIELENNVIFTGFIHHDDLPVALSFANVFVMPSIYEELGSTILEAMAMRKAIVATAVGGIPEIINHMENGLLIPPAHPEDLATAISALLNNNDLAQQLATQASLDAQKYSLRDLALKLQQIYLIVSHK